jgi:hypothetical protein
VRAFRKTSIPAVFPSDILFFSKLKFALEGWRFNDVIQGQTLGALTCLKCRASGNPFSNVQCALVGGEWSTSRPGRFTPGERAPGTHWIGGWVDLRAGLDDMENRKFLTLPVLELRPLDRTACS